MEGRPWRDLGEVVKMVGEAKAARRLRVGERLRPGRVAENGRGARVERPDNRLYALDRGEN